jgi:hypothetical protein
MKSIVFYLTENQSGMVNSFINIKMKEKKSWQEAENYTL